MTAARKRAPVPREQMEQAALFAWARNPSVQRAYPELRLLSCSLNGVRLTPSQAAKAKAAGMLKGEHDVRLPVARCGFHGLSIEMKAKDGTISKEQKEYGALLMDEGYLVYYCFDWQCAMEAILDYLSGHLHAENGSIIKPRVRKTM